MVKRQSYAAVVNQPQPQTVQTDKRQVKNDAGGYVYTVDKWTVLNRFLILGTESGNYYVSAEKATFQAQRFIIDCLNEDGMRVVNMAVTVSQEGLAPKNDAAIWVISMACSPKYALPEVNKYALERMKYVARTLTHLYQFLEAVQTVRGWGRGLRNAVAGWFMEMGVSGAAYQAVKYRQRNGWSGKDVLKLSHVQTNDAGLNAVFRWLVGDKDWRNGREVKRKQKGGQTTSSYPEVAAEQIHPLITGFELAQKAETAVQLMPIIEEHDLTWEMIPNQFLKERGVWWALIQHMPYHALMRNLANMTRAGVFDEPSMTTFVVERLTNEKAIVKSRIHPIQILAAQMTYAQGKGMRGGNEWTPNRRISDALSDAFPLSFNAVDPTGKRLLIACDCSGSMSAAVNGMDYLSAAQAAGALALMEINIEPDADLIAFGTKVAALNLSRRDNLDKSMQVVGQINAGGTDTTVPIKYALEQFAKKGKVYDAIILLTDDQTWAGDRHFQPTVEEYRRKANKDARIVICSMTTNEFSSGAPDDTLALRIAGMDTSAPALISAFVAGKF